MVRAAWPWDKFKTLQKLYLSLGAYKFITDSGWSVLIKHCVVFFSYMIA